MMSLQILRKMKVSSDGWEDEEGLRDLVIMRMTERWLSWHASVPFMSSIRW